MFFQQDQPASKDTPNEIDFNPDMLVEKLDTWLDGFIKLLPNLAVAVVIFILFYFVAGFVKKMVKKIFHGRDRDNLGRMLGGLARYTTLIMGFLLAATVVVPSLNPGDLIAGLGVSSVAIGFAFKDILQNWLAGLLILIRQPFEIGDQIVVNDYEGTVMSIETRATIIKTYNGERIVIPNSEIYTNSVKVKTAHDIIRSQYDVGIGYGDDIDEAISVIKEKVEALKVTNEEKGVEVLPWDLAASWVTLRVRWWTKSERAEVVKTKTKVIPAIKAALDEARIDMPYETVVQLWHDQTEATDGDRSKQREGWPLAKDDEGTQPRWEAVQKSSKQKDTSTAE